MKSQYLGGFDPPRVKNLRTWVEVDTNSLKHNLKEARRAVGKNVNLLVVVKANAYGHGLVGSAQIAVQNGAQYLGVDSIDEGVELRKANIRKPILVLGYIPNARLSDVSKFNFEIAVYNQETIRGLARTAKKLRTSEHVHLKIETGTSRQGILLDELPEFIRLLTKYPYVKVRGVYTHFADTENPKSTYYRTQVIQFKKALAILKRCGFGNFMVHAASSAAVWLYPETHFDMVRLGISYYGFWPSQGVERIAKRRGMSLKPALSWRTRIAQVKRLKKGTWIGYDRTERLKKDSVIAVLPVGYQDGYDRRLSGIGVVIVRGKRCRVIGRVCMNMLMVDVTGIKNVKPGDVVTLFGRSGREEITVEDLARLIDTINYEILVRINPLLPRIYS